MSDFLEFFQLISNGDTADYAINVPSKDTRESPMRPRFCQQKIIKFLLLGWDVLLVSFMENFNLTYGIHLKHLWRCGQAVQHPSPPKVCPRMPREQFKITERTCELCGQIISAKKLRKKHYNTKYCKEQQKRKAEGLPTRMYQYGKSLRCMLILDRLVNILNC